MNDVFNGFLLGKKLGNGIDREVFVYRANEDQVIKIETGSGNYQNVMELQVWASAVDQLPHSANLKNHLAQVFQISDYGTILRMERTWPPPSGFKWPNKMPAGLGDFKRSNYGLTKDGRLVCHDYGSSLFIHRGISKAMRKADWWD